MAHVRHFGTSPSPTGRCPRSDGPRGQGSERVPAGTARPMFYSPFVSAQAPSAVILIRAEKFVPNPATAADNAFQGDAPAGQSDDITSAHALAEMDAVADA